MVEYHYAASVMLVTPDGRMLLQERDDKPGILSPGKLTYWGGAVQAGERPVDAAMREIREETNLSPAEHDLQLFGEYKQNYTINDRQFINTVFMLRDVDEQTLKVYEGQGFHSIDPQAQTSDERYTQLTTEIIQDWNQSGK